MMTFLHKGLGLAVLVLLAACTKADNGVRVSTQVAQPGPAPVQKARVEPIFYNGKTYELKFAPQGAGVYYMAIHGMSQAQQKDAVAVATSSLRYFACPDGKTGKLASSPVYGEGQWSMTARCG